jgi:hypothetical protein
MDLFKNRRDVIILSIIILLSVVTGMAVAWIVNSTFLRPKTELTQEERKQQRTSKVFPKGENLNNPDDPTRSSLASSSVSLETRNLAIPPQFQKSPLVEAQRDYMGQKITNYLKQNGINLGYVWSRDISLLGHSYPISSDLNNSELDRTNSQPQNLSAVIQQIPNCEKKNILSYPKYGVEAPINYASFGDLYNNNKATGLTDIRNPIEEDPNAIGRGNYESVPIQKLLKLGIVHLPISPHPGQVGNSYIVGHTSNFPSVRSNYNYIFKPFERRSVAGEEFWIIDNECRQMKFRVFEAIAINADDVATAYKTFGDKRVVTLQGSILDKFYQPTMRWLTRGELVLDK